MEAAEERMAQVARSIYSDEMPMPGLGELELQPCGPQTEMELQLAEPEPEPELESEPEPEQ